MASWHTCPRFVGPLISISTLILRRLTDAIFTSRTSISPNCVRLSQRQMMAAIAINSFTSQHHLIMFPSIFVFSLIMTPSMNFSLLYYWWQVGITANSSFVHCAKAQGSIEFQRISVIRSIKEHTTKSKKIHGFGLLYNDKETVADFALHVSFILASHVGSFWGRILLISSTIFALSWTLME